MSVSRRLQNAINDLDTGAKPFDHLFDGVEIVLKVGIDADQRASPSALNSPAISAFWWPRFRDNLIPTTTRRLVDARASISAHVRSLLPSSTKKTLAVVGDFADSDQPIDKCDDAAG